MPRVTDRQQQLRDAARAAREAQGRAQSDAERNALRVNHAAEERRHANEALIADFLKIMRDAGNPGRERRVVHYSHKVRSTGPRHKYWLLNRFISRTVWGWSLRGSWPGGPEESATQGLFLTTDGVLYNYWYGKANWPYPFRLRKFGTVDHDCVDLASAYLSDSDFVKPLVEQGIE